MSAEETKTDTVANTAAPELDAKEQAGEKRKAEDAPDAPEAEKK